MIRHKLKNGGQARKKALFGMDGAITSAAILTAAGINASAQAAAAAINSAATNNAAKKQADATIQNANTQAESIKQQSANNTQLQKESIDFTKQQNQETRQQQQDIQTTLQMLAGQQNMVDNQERNKMAVKYGGNKNNKRRKLVTQPFYGGGQIPFTVTDGGGVVPLQVDQNGYGLYEIYGNDHDHYHKTTSGKYKSGVGFKFNDGTIIEGEGNQNSNSGEKLLVTPNDAMFISKHSIDGFNPSKAVDAGMNPIDAFATQEQLKSINGINDDGSRQDLSRRRGLNGFNIVLDNAIQAPIDTNINSAMVVGAANNVAKCGTHRKLRCGGREKAINGNLWNDYGGAIINGAGNIVGAGITGLGNYFAGRSLSKAYNKAGNIIANAYDNMTGIDLSNVSKDDYSSAHAMATIRSANTNYNPQFERLRRNAESESNNVNRNTLSSAARQQRLAGINDRMYQRLGELYATKQNADEQIKQQNAQTITDVSKTNAQLDAQSNQQYIQSKLALLQYNNDINNAKIAGRAQALGDAITQSASVRSSALANTANALGAAINSTGQGFSTAMQTKVKNDRDFANTYIGLDTPQKIDAAIMRYNDTGDKTYINALLSGNQINDAERSRLNKIIGNQVTLRGLSKVTNLGNIGSMVSPINIGSTTLNLR